jgi:hypothetical protein
VSVSKRLRYEILRRDGHLCRYCGAAAPEVSLTVDHVVPVALGGSDDPSNLVAACAECNAGKAASNPDAPIVESVADDALRWAAAMREAAQVQADDKAAREIYVAQFDAAWSGWKYPGGQEVPRPDDWRGSLERFADLGLEVRTLIDFLPRAMGRGRHGDFPEFSYLCGMAWRTLQERQQIARDIVAAAAAT